MMDEDKFRKLIKALEEYGQSIDDGKPKYDVTIVATRPINKKKEL